MPRVVSDQKVASQALYFGYGSNLSTSLMAVRCPHSTAEGLGFLPNWAWLIDQSGFANIMPGAEADDDLLPGVYGMLYRLTEEDEDSLDMSEGVPRSYDKILLDVRVVEEAEEFEVIGDTEARSRKKWYKVGQKQVTQSNPFAAVDAMALSGKLSALLAIEEAGQAGPSRQTRSTGTRPAEPSDEGSRFKKAPRLRTATTQDPLTQRTVQVFAYANASRTTPSAPSLRYIGRVNTGIDEANTQWGLPRGYVDQVLRPFIPAGDESL